ncbi:sensor histidine kinase [Nocardia bovistercoris]|uniref:histidine kinase n=1 Tax=Nocardia bovistercoris TaxID=2785916 RepID=A0A931N4S0_9NOCA|nr:ATP-binding protein [Nocardia bovistercoris]MBH0777908.1 nitrate- and nitrite sensing domain-containing protein [Nocardia bovistercoris]
MGVSIGAAVYLIKDGRKSKDWAEFAAETTTPAITMIEAFQAERAASMLVLAGDPTAPDKLAAARGNSDSALAYLLTYSQTSREVRPELVDDMSGFDQLYASMPMLRGGIDARAMPPDQVFGAFSAIIDTIVTGNLIAATVSPASTIAVDMIGGIPMLRATEAVSKALSIGSTALITNQISPEHFTDFMRNVGDARAQLGYADGMLTGQRQAQLRAITEGQAWQQLVAMGDAFMRRGVITGADAAAPTSEDSASGRNPTTTTRRATATGSAALPLTITEWTNAAVEVNAALLKLWKDQNGDAHDRAMAAGEKREQDSLHGAIAIAGLTLLAFLAALWLTNRLIRRMRRLRAQTLEVADERLPSTIRALSDGAPSNASIEMTPLDFGRDEIGQVADAFNRAHSSAVAAAVAESKTRAGVNAVFLNIAHRNQVIVHRQLALLDTAERGEENPGTLDVLFQLDHLATRSRRNAENLIILGGEKPGRRWRNPVPLIDVVRGAVAESTDYTRIQIAKLPSLRITGGAVADLIHLLAELTDNATAFSPPQTRVEVTGNQIGRGVAIEIIDQGLGMAADELTERNALLAEPPDFSVAALSSDARLGLFVVATLAVRHGISVRLVDSDYGGVKAVVVVPTTLVVEDGAEVPVRDRLPVHEPRPRPPVFEQAPPPAIPAPWPAPPIDPSKPALPRRRRGEDAVGDYPTMETRAVPPPRPRTADQARDLMSAIEGGTRQGRRDHAESGHRDYFDEQEGTGDHRHTP